MGEECEMKGWLYLLRFNRFGLQYARKRYFILEDSGLRSFKSIPSSETEEPLRSAIIDSCVRVIDNGRESHRMKVFFVFTLVNTSNHNDMLKLGATSSEDAARWIRALQDAALNSVSSLTSCSKRKWQPFSLSVSKRMANKRCVDQASVSSKHVNAMTSDVIAPSPWKIFGCQNGLRLFKESKDRDSNWKHWGDHPAIMAVGVVDEASEDVFHTLMSLGTSRTEWDFCFYQGSVIEHLDGHTDIIYIQLYNHWLPWAMKRRDLLLRRYWRREEDGTYVILYHSVVHRKCPPQSGYVRAYLKSGGYVISPTKQGKECVIKNMLAMDWRFWKSYIRKTSSRSITIRMLGRVAALREFFRAKSGNSSHECASRELTIASEFPVSDKKAIMTEVGMHSGPYKDEDVPARQISGASSLFEMDDAADEFFDVPEPIDDEPLETEWCSNKSPELCYMDKYQPKFSSSANFVKKLHDLAVQKKGYLELREISWEESVSSCYSATLPKDSTFNIPCSWAAADASSFLIRDYSYLQDRRKIKAKGTLMEMVAADWLRSDKREDDLAGRYGGIVQRYAAQGGPEFFFIINIQVPGSASYSLALYYMLKTPLEETPLLERFVNGDDAFRNSRFKLIPYISKVGAYRKCHKSQNKFLIRFDIIKTVYDNIFEVNSQGSWIVKQSVGKKACLIGQALEINYFRGKNYLELGVDIGSSTVARGVVGLVLGYLNNLVIEMAFLIQGNTEDELPEFLLGTCRLNHLDASKSVPTDSISSSSSS